MLRKKKEPSVEANTIALPLEEKGSGDIINWLIIIDTMFILDVLMDWKDCLSVIKNQLGLQPSLQVVPYVPLLKVGLIIFSIIY